VAAGFSDLESRDDSSMNGFFFFPFGVLKRRLRNQNGNVNESRDISESPGESSLFSLTLYKALEMY
jgi:hypothetical protein